MNDDAAEWYYTTGSDQAGPVTFEELKARAAASELHPRNDMVWNKGMDEWVPAGQIENLFERRGIDSIGPTAVPSMAGTIPSMPTMTQSIPEKHVEVVVWPGASRRWYFLLTLLFPFFWIVLALTFATFVGPKLSPGFQKIFLLLGLIVPIWVVIDTSLNRLSNLGMNKLWFFVQFVPIINIWLGYRIIACPAGYAKTKKLDPIGWFLAIFYWLSMVGCVASAIFIPAVISTQMNDPELIKKFEEIREQIETAMGKKEDGGENPDEADQPDPAP